MGDDDPFALEVDSMDEPTAVGSPRPRWIDLLKLRQTWGTIASRGLTDPIWFFITDWFAIFLVATSVVVATTFVSATQLSAVIPWERSKRTRSSTTRCASARSRPGK